MKVSEAIPLLQEVLETAGDVEIKIDAGYVFDVCREMYLDFKEYRTNQFVVFSKNKMDWRRNRAHNFKLGDVHKKVHPRNINRKRR